MKVFISYSRKDAEFVNKLKEALEASDIGVIIDVESLEFGDNLQAFLEQSVRETDLTIAVISKHSLQSVWVIAEALETLMYEHVEGRKRFLPIYIDTSFLDDTLYLQIVEQIDASIDKLKELTAQAIEKKLGTSLYDQKRKRLISLRNNLDTILAKLADVLVADFSNEKKFAENLPKLIEAIEQAEKAREQYTGRPSAYLAPFQAPPLPGHFVPRPEVTDVLKVRLLKDEQTTPGILVVSAIHGLGGIGKSTLAAALAYDRNVQKRFPDGILWTTLGQQPDILSLISGWIQALRDYDFRPTTIEAASNHLRTLLQDKAALLVVDDVWNPEHAIHFKIGGPRCQVLITTRRADVADEVGAELHQMDVMTPEQSLDLLAARVQRSLDAAEREEALSLAEAVGYLPLALELAAVRVARGMPWTALCQALEQETAHLEALESAHRRRKGAAKLEASFNLSLNALRNDDEEAWRAFVWLGVLPKDVQIAAPMAATLWNMEEAEATEILELLWNDALLIPGKSLIIGEKNWRFYRQHDLLHEITRKLLTMNHPIGLNLILSEAHATLLNRYKQHARNALWHTLPDDGYIHSHLVWHFQQAGQEEQIHVLLREETPDRRNGWYHARESLGQTPGFLADVNLAWNLAQETTNIGLQCRYALLLGSFNSLAKIIPVELMIALVEEGIWNPAQGFAYACQIPNPLQRIETLAGLSSNLPFVLEKRAMQEMLAAVQTVQNIRDQTEALAKIIFSLPTSLMEEVLTMVKAIEDTKARVKALASIVPHLPERLREDTLQEAIRGTQMVEDVEIRVKMLVEIVPYVPENMKEQVLQKILAMIQKFENEWYQTEILTGLASYLSEPLLQKALIIAQAIESESKRSEALSKLIPRLAELGIVEEALAKVQVIEHESVRYETLLGMAPYLSEPLLQDVVTTVQKIENEEYRSELLIKLAPVLPKSLLWEAIAVIRSVGTNGIRKWEKKLVDILPRLAELGKPKEALTAAQSIEDMWYRAEALAGVAPHLPEPLLRETLTTVRAIEGTGARVWTMARLVPYLPESLRKETLQEISEAVQSVADPGYRSWVFAELVSHLPKPLRKPILQGIFTEALTIGDKGALVEALAGLAPYLSESLLKEILLILERIDDIGYCVEALIEMAPHLSEPLLRRALSIAKMIKDTGYREQVFIYLIPHLGRYDAAEEALRIAKTLEGIGVCARTLTGIAFYLPGHWKENVLREVLAMAQAIEYEDAQAELLAELAGNLPESLLEEALTIALAIQSEWAQAEALAGLAPYLSRSLFFRALETARAIKIERSRDRALAGLMPRLAEYGDSERALMIVREIEDARDRAEALAGVASYLPEPLRQNTLQEALVSTELIENIMDLTRALTTIAPHLSESQFWEVVNVVKTIENVKNRSRMLTGLAPCLGELPYTSLLSLWQELLENLVHHTRKNILTELRALTPVVAKLGGEKAIVELFHAIQDVGRWWS